MAFYFCYLPLLRIDHLSVAGSSHVVIDRYLLWSRLCSIGSIRTALSWNAAIPQLRLSACLLCDIGQVCDVIRYRIHLKSSFLLQHSRSTQFKMGWIRSEVKAEDALQPVPGTVHLVDLDGTLHAKHAKNSGLRDVVLVPAPSSDPDDPLNWSPARKRLSTTCMCVYTLMVGIASAAIYSVLVPISEATGLTLGDLNAGTGYMFLAFGWGCLFWQPLALQYGKRPVYLISILATMGIQVWAPYTTSNGQWIANKVLREYTRTRFEIGMANMVATEGFFGAPIESLCEISVADMYISLVSPSRDIL